MRRRIAEKRKARIIKKIKDDKERIKEEKEKRKRAEESDKLMDDMVQEQKDWEKVEAWRKKYDGTGLIFEEMVEQEQLLEEHKVQMESTLQYQEQV